MPGEVDAGAAQQTGSVQEQSGNPSPSAFSGNMNEQAAGWTASLPEKYRSDADVVGLKSIDELVDGYKGYKQKFGVSPKDVSEYDFKFDGVDAGAVDAFKKDAFEAGLPKAVAEKIAKSYIERATAAYNAEQAQLAERQNVELRTLQNEFGQGWGEVSKAATEAVRQIGGQELLDTIQSSGLSTNPTLFKAMVKVGQLLKEGRLPDDGSGSALSSSADVQAEIDRLYADKDFMESYRSTRSPDYQKAQDRMFKLFERRLELSKSGK